MDWMMSVITKGELIDKLCLGVVGHKERITDGTLAPWFSDDVDFRQLEKYLLSRTKDNLKEFYFYLHRALGVSQVEHTKYGPTPKELQLKLR